MYRYIMILALIFLLTGCASVFNPYDEEPDCPAGYDGDCTPVRNAYLRSITDPNNTNHLAGGESPLIKEGNMKKGADVSKHQPYSFYANIPVPANTRMMPVEIPETRLRCLVVGYEEGGNYYGERFIYFKAGESKWMAK